MTKTLTGGCCCGKVSFSVKDQFNHFFFCHCQQCRQMTGSAHASNLFTSVDNIVWESGTGFIKCFSHPERNFSKAFCTECGSALPYVSSSGKSLIVPAGSLNEEPSKPVDAQIFCAEQAGWHLDGLSAKKMPGFP
ncbi:Glutathione-dependent formaldehyde-activating enzyme [Vibrio aerogenes CECT 7868]|uniref:Glutathione-dependent formaldehyde-activating enzyme n=1 Tax=Vibrio aerogenes CECT 7868 TaxID=1216006 RepID=A0A1M6BZ15_9VIBR|nr:GFA family protein [Vibrio aerogenes]SHI54036.1 Glutathione-dependent formaldehyde-activating enzyme [Vibrio aerogenes CECT 7868]